MKKYIMVCVEIEETAAKIYRQVSESSNIPEELKVILQHLANDEDDHASQLRFALRFPAGAAIVEKTLDLAPVQALLERAKDLLSKAKQQDFGTKQAIDLGIELEQDFCQTHIGNSLELKDEGLKNMFAAMAQDDKTHCQKLQDAKLKFF